MKHIPTYWGKLSPKMRYELASGIKTVIAAMIIELGLQLQSNAAQITSGTALRAVLVAILASVVRAGVKALWAFIVSQIKTRKKS